VERAEAEAILDGDRETAVGLLLRVGELVEANRRLEAPGDRARAAAAGVPRSSFGPRLQAAVVTLAVRNRVSRRDTTELARELFGVELSTGSVDAIMQRTGAALAAPHTRLEQEIKSAPVVNIDETGWKTQAATGRSGAP
jgi:hypothetical protein